MTDTRTFRVKNAGDVLAMVPYLLGFHPEDSVVMVTVGGSGRQLHARVDLPDDPADFPHVVRSLTRAAERNDVERVVVVAYSDDHATSEDLVDVLRDELEDVGVTVEQAIRADGERWYSLSGCTSSCCPSGGTPYDLSSHPLTAQAVLDGQVTLRSRQELADSLVGTDLDDKDEVTVAAANAQRRLAGAARHPLGVPAPDGTRAHLVGEALWVRERVRRFLDDGDRFTAEEVGRMVVALSAIGVRDVAWAEMDRGRAARHVDLWRDVVRRCPFDLLAAPAALLGFAAWLSGDGALAWCAIERCQSAEPDYGLAGLLTTALTNAIPPSTWEPLADEQLPLLAG